MSNGNHHTLRARFNQFARKAAQATGHPYAFLIAVGIIIVWALTGPFFQFNDTWQLVINTGTTIVTFLMVFLIQNTQNRDSLAMQIKMDEVIRAVQGAHNSMLNLEELEDEELQQLHQKYTALAERARQELEQGATDDDCPDLDNPEGRSCARKEDVRDEINEEVGHTAPAASNGAPRKTEAKRAEHGSRNGVKRKTARVKPPRKRRSSRKSA